ncbi:hypothetical protein PV646_21520 [Streptomyces sp. ID05-26A]|nr:hypothetical protein [Streptomyces sp. ID05-26A]
MRRTWSVAVARDDRLDVDWQHVGHVLGSWADRGAALSPIGEVMWLADTGSAEVADALADAVAALGLTPLRSSGTVFEDQDYATADYVGVTGADLSLAPPFVLGEPFRDDPPCPECGHHDAFDVTRVRPIRIDESLLDAPAPGGARPGPNGWEVVNLPDGGLLLSARLISALREVTDGLVVEDVLDAHGEKSVRMAALRAAVAVLAPCPRHTRFEGEPPCPLCGTARSSVDGCLQVPRSVAGTAGVVSRHPHRAALLYVSQAVFAVLKDVPGVRRGDPVGVCED